MKSFLRDYQMDAVNKMSNGCILNGGVGSGKSRTGLFYYFKEQGGWLDTNGYKKMKNPKDLYIITTAMKRDSLEWESELLNYRMSTNPEENQYKNSKYFIDSVKEARKFEKSNEKLVIIAGACQSNYEALIKAGANFASSPKRVNIHALDPAIIACNLALTERNKEINLIELLSKTKNGVDGMGGLICNGMMYVGYPR